MKLIDSSVEILSQYEGIEGVFKQIEIAGRTCYKSEDKITEDSAEKFVQKMIDSKHGAMLEHGTVYLLASTYDPIDYAFYDTNPYSKCIIYGGNYYITTNYRVLVENKKLDDLKYICQLPTIWHELRVSVRFICSRAITHELVRHRVFSFGQESQRYCAYNKDKFGNQITFIIPQWIYDVRNELATCVDPLTLEHQTYLKDLTGESLVRQLGCLDRTVAAWYNRLQDLEKDYLWMLNTDEGYKLKPQEARGLLPNDCKTEIVMTGFLSDWDHFFDLRCAPSAHPDMQKLANELEYIFVKHGVR